MNQTTAIHIWQGTNRLSGLWEDLLANYVSPEPLSEENTSSAAERELYSPLETVGWEADSPAAWREQNEPVVTTLLEKEGFESLRQIRQVLEILSSPSEQELTLDTSRSQYTDAAGHATIQAESGPGLTYIKVSSEPEPQPGSAIDTRRIAYGLKVPIKPLHKRSLLQRLFFCIRSWISMVSRSSYEPSSH